MKKRTLLGGMLLAAAISIASVAQAISYDVYAMGNSSSGGVPVDTISLVSGEAFSVSAAEDDLWNAGARPRWSNADGLVADLFATGTDESGLGAGTKIGQAFSLWTQDGFSAPFGALVGQIGSSYILLGTNFMGTAPEDGVLKLMYWDSNNGDNSDYITVEVNRGSAVPDEGGIVLSILGGLMLVGFRFIAKRRGANS